VSFKSVQKDETRKTSSKNNISWVYLAVFVRKQLNLGHFIMRNCNLSHRVHFNSLRLK